MYALKWVSYGASNKGTEPLCRRQLAGDEPGEIRALMQVPGERETRGTNGNNVIVPETRRSLSQITRKCGVNFPYACLPQRMRGKYFGIRQERAIERATVILGRNSSHSMSLLLHIGLRIPWSECLGVCVFFFFS